MDLNNILNDSSSSLDDEPSVTSAPHPQYEKPIQKATKQSSSPQIQQQTSTQRKLRPIRLASKFASPTTPKSSSTPKRTKNKGKGVTNAQVTLAAASSSSSNIVISNSSTLPRTPKRSTSIRNIPKQSTLEKDLIQRLHPRPPLHGDEQEAQQQQNPQQHISRKRRLIIRSAGSTDEEEEEEEEDGAEYTEEEDNEENEQPSNSRRKKKLAKIKRSKAPNSAWSPEEDDKLVR